MYQKKELLIYHLLYIEKQTYHLIQRPLLSFGDGNTLVIEFQQFKFQISCNLL